MFKLTESQEICTKKGLNILKKYNLVYLNMEMRVGKSLTALSISHFYGAKKVLFVTKKEAIKSVLSDFKLSGYDIDLLVTNYEQLDNIDFDPDIIVLDESNEKISAFPKMGKYAKICKRICRGKPIIFCSGTATPESFSQLYHQMHMSDWSPWKEYTNFYKWANVYVNKNQRVIGGFNVNDYSCAKEDLVLSETNHLFVSMTQKEAGFSDEVTDYTHVVEMSDLTKKMISLIKKDKMIRGKEYTYIADTAAKEMLAIHQIATGTLKIDDTKSVTFDRSKIDYIKTNFKGQKIAIFYNFIQEGVMLKECFEKWTDIDTVFNESSDMVYIGQIVSKRSGVSLRTADCLIFLSTPFSATSYLQGRARHAHRDRDKPCDVHFLLADCGIDKYVYKTVKNKNKFTTAHYKRNKNNV